MNSVYSHERPKVPSRARSYTFVAAILVFLVCGYQMFGNEKTVQVTLKESGTAVTIHSGDQLEVTLPATFGTGYSWQVEKAAENVLTVKGAPETKQSKADRKTGQTEYQVFRFVSSAKGRGQLELHYARPWEKDEKPAKVFYLTVEVQ